MMKESKGGKDRNNNYGEIIWGGYKTRRNSSLTSQKVTFRHIASYIESLE